MAKQFFTSIDLQKNELLNAVIHKSASAPSTPAEGQVYFNTSDDKMYVYNGTEWVSIGADIALTVAADSTSFLSIVDNEIHFSNLAITEVHVDTTNTTITEFVADSYTVGNEYQEGDVIILTASTDQGQRTWIHNGGTAGTIADFTALTTTVSTSVIRAALTGGDGIAYNSETGDIDVDHDSSLAIVNGKLSINGSVVGPSILEQISGASGVFYNTSTYEITADVDGSTIQVGASGIEVKDAGITEAKLATDLAAKINDTYVATFGNGTDAVHTITHNLNTKDIIVQIYRISDGACIECDVTRDTVNTVTLGAYPIIASNNARIVIKKAI